MEVEVGVPPVLAGCHGRGEQGADVVPGGGGFDLDHFRALAGQDFGRVGAGPDHGEVGDADALQGSSGFGHVGFLDGVEFAQADDVFGVVAEFGEDLGQVLAEFGGGCVGPAVVIGGPEAAGVGEGSGFGVGGGEVAAAVHVPVFGEVLDGGDVAEGDAVLDAELEQFFGGALGEPGVEDGRDLVVMFGAGGGVVDDVHGAEGVVVDGIEQAGQVAGEGADAAVAVGGGVDAPGGGDEVAAALVLDAELGGAGHEGFGHAGVGFDDGEVDVGALAVDERGVGGGGDGGEGVEAGLVGGLGTAVLERGAVGVAGEPGLPAGGEHGEFGGGQFGIGAGLAEGGDRGHDQLGAVAGERFVAEAEFVEAAGGGGFDDDVGGRGQLGEDGAAVAGFEVEGEAPLRAVEVEEESAGFVVGHVAGPGAEGAGSVAGRGLDLDHVGAEGGEPAAGEGAGDAFGEFDHADAVVGPRCVWRGGVCHGGEFRGGSALDCVVHDDGERGNGRDGGQAGRTAAGGRARGRAGVGDRGAVCCEAAGRCGSRGDQGGAAGRRSGAGLGAVRHGGTGSGGGDRVAELQHVEAERGAGRVQRRGAAADAGAAGRGGRAGDRFPPPASCRRRGWSRRCWRSCSRGW